MLCNDVLAANTRARPLYGKSKKYKRIRLLLLSSLGTACWTSELVCFAYRGHGS